MSIRAVIGASIVTTLLFAACGSGDDSVATLESVPGTLGDLDDVVITVAAEDLAGETVRLEDIDGDGEVEIVPTEVIGRTTDADSESTVTRIDASGGGGDDDSDVIEDRDDQSSDGGRNPFGGDQPEDKRMPDVICMGLQDAQNEIQDRGVLLSKSEDATGDGRRQLWDRNWIVVAQDPDPGEAIGENEAVLYVVKTNEDNDC